MRSEVPVETVEKPNFNTNQQKINLNCVSIQLRKYVVFDSANKAHSVHQVIEERHS